MNNSLTKRNKKQAPSFQSFMKSPVVVRNITETLGSETKSKKFIASLISSVSTNPALSECDQASIVSAALLGEALNLSPSPQLGHYYMVPFNDKKNSAKKATFQLGYKGYIQLAIRSGQYKRINVVAVKEGELIGYNPFDEQIDVEPIMDETIRENTPTVGYYAIFELVNGFRKAIYWSKEKMLYHADRYSQAFHKDEGTVNTQNGTVKRVSFEDFESGNYDPRTEWLYSSFWYKDFDGMAYKTMLRQLISKWGIMSIDMQQAFTNDMSYKDGFDAQPVYVDNDTENSAIEDVPTNATNSEEHKEADTIDIDAEEGFSLV